MSQRIVNTKKASTRFNDDKFHRAYGIQNWLCSKGYCMKPGGKWKVDPDQYTDLIKEFIKYKKPDFDFSKGITSWESWVDKNFSAFCNFAKYQYTKGKYSQEKP